MLLVMKRYKGGRELLNIQAWSKDEYVVYRAWVSMKARCRPTFHDRHIYFNRGITVCERWLTYKNFREDMGLKPSFDHSLDRIDNDKGYTPENCRWATPTEQTRNTRRCRS